MTHAVRALLLLSLWVPVAGCNRAAAAGLRSTSTESEPVATTAPLPPGPTTREALGYLASDDLEGRGIGTKGIDRAADYIVEQFKNDGLRPLPGLDGYFQRFEMTTGAAVDNGTTLALAGEALTLDKSFKPLSFSASGKLADVPVVFAGYGITSSKQKYDDYANVDVKGKAALVLRFEPHNAEGKSRFAEKGYSDDATFKQKARNAAEHGAVALFVVNPPQHHGKDSFVPFAGQFTDSRANIPVVQISVEAANALLEKAEVVDDLAALQKKIDASGRPASLALKDVAASGDIRIAINRAGVKNIVAVAPGRGPLKDEYIVVGAHYDHVGKDRRFSAGAKEGEIHNGADDNASGTTTMLGLARHFAQRSTPRRSIIFIAFTGEEWGLIGSEYFVDHPPVPLKQITAMLNMDMVGRVQKEKLYVGGMGTGAQLESIVKAADESSPLTVIDIGKGGLGPSDHMSFALKKIPVLFLFSGMHGDYHKPSDDADKVNYDALGEVERLAQDVINQLATAPRMEYVATADKTSPRIGSTGNGGERRTALGVIPDMTAMDSTDGAKIQGTTPGTPAEAAGLKEGDVITRFGDKRINDLMDLSAALSEAKPGDKVKLKVKRDGGEIELDATLAERKD
jgi:Zn-dependent M28 family amino/carboxypeptidase